MAQVYVGIGSNIDREYNIRGGIKRIKSLYDDVVISKVYECAAFGFEGDDFYNLVAGFKTTQSLSKVAEMLRHIEFEFGRRRTETKYSPRSLDIDILMYDDMIDEQYKIPRNDILEYAFVLKPLSEISPDLLHPVEKQTMSELWKNFDATVQAMEEVEFCLN